MLTRRHRSLLVTLLIGPIVLSQACATTTDPVAEGSGRRLRSPTKGIAEQTTAPQTSSSVTMSPGSSPPGTESDNGVDGFTFTSAPIDEATRTRMQGVSMRPGCPVQFDDLRLLHIGYVDFDGRDRVGEMVVHRSVVDGVRAVFERLHAERFPIRRMTLVDDFGRAKNPADGADDFKSIEADNTSAFNCRTRTGSASRFSQHSYGTAIDVNPLENPYLRSGRTSHPASMPFLDRSTRLPGMVLEGDAVVQAFGDIGWRWGGTWSDPVDLQHFSQNGD